MKRIASPKRPARDFLKALTIIVLLYAVIFGCGLAFYSFFSLSCGNDVVSESYSPDNQFKVVIFDRNCGATTRLNTMALLLKADGEISDMSAGNFYVANDVEVEVTWQSNREIQVTYLSSTQITDSRVELKYSGHIFGINYQTSPNE